MSKFEAALLKIAENKDHGNHAHYIGAGISKYRFLKVTVPQVRKFSAQIFSTMSWQELDQVWQKTLVYDLLLAVVIAAQKKSIEEKWEHRKVLLSWSLKADNWALADSMCGIYAQMFEAHPKEMLSVLEKWSRSKNPWLRRMSIVSIFYYSSQRRRYPSYAMVEKFILRQLHDDHFYVQRGVGWTLRECWNVYPDKTFQLLKKIAAYIPSAGWTAATEKLSKKEKDLLKALRAR